MDKDEVPESAESVVHGLHYGYPLCRFTWEKPNDWPDGHLFVRGPRVDEITCVRCKTEAEFLALQGAKVGT